MKNIVVQVYIDDNERAQGQNYHLSKQSWISWCKGNDADYLVLDQRIDELQHVKPQWYKILIPQILQSQGIDYDNVLVVDADTIVHPKCPNIFNMTDGKFTVVRNYGNMDWVCRSTEVYHKFFTENIKPDIEVVSPFEYFNSGLFIFNKSHADFLNKTFNLMLQVKDQVNHYQQVYGVGNDQPFLNYAVKMFGIDVKYLPYEYNMQDLMRFELLNDTMFEVGYIYHFNAGVKPSPGDWMQYAYNHFKPIYDELKQGI